jgi:hypothetical protein
VIFGDAELVMVESRVVVTADRVSFSVFGRDEFLIKFNKKN